MHKLMYKILKENKAYRLPNYKVNNEAIDYSKECVHHNRRSLIKNLKFYFKRTEEKKKLLWKKINKAKTFTYTS
jgi:hypothetical protein